MDRLKEKLVEATRKMRKLQKNYFRRKDQKTLKEAIRAEHEVDLILENLHTADGENEETSHE